MAIVLFLLAAIAGLAFLLYRMAIDLFEYAVHVRKGDEKETEQPKHYELTEFQSKNPFYVEALAWYKEVPKELKTIRSFDGFNLKANYIQKQGGDKICLIVPGWTDRKEYLFAENKLFWDMGFSIFCPDQRAHGESEGKYACFGANEHKDMSRWLKMIAEMGYKKIVLFGRSMGAATVMLTASHEKETPILCAIEDSGYTSLEEQGISFTRSKVRWIPPFALAIMIHVLGSKVVQKAGFDIKAANPRVALGACKVPMLFIHGKEDHFVPYTMLDDLYAAHPGEKQRLDVENAAHVASLLMDTEKYKKTVQQFLNTYMTEVNNG